MIRVKSGRVGVRLGNGAVVVKSPADRPFSLTFEEEQRLVRRGVAVFCADGAACPEAGAAAAPGVPARPAYGPASRAPEPNALMRAAGLKVPVGMTNADKAAALDEFYAAGAGLPAASGGGGAAGAGGAVADGGANTGGVNTGGADDGGALPDLSAEDPLF